MDFTYIMFIGFIYVIVCNSILIFLIAEYFITDIYILLIHSRLDIQCCFHCEANTNTAAMKMHVQVFMWT